MIISRIIIKNFRNFHNLDVSLGDSLVVLGENRIGKTNLLYALRLVLEPTLPDSARQLSVEDFWDGIQNPEAPDSRIHISIEISDFEHDFDQLAILADHIVKPQPMTAKLTYEFGALEDGQSANQTKFGFSTYGGDRPENRFGYELRKRMPFEFLSALRDAEADLSRWGKSPLRPLIERVQTAIDPNVLNGLAQSISQQTSQIAQENSIDSLAKKINHKLSQMAGVKQAIQTDFGFASTDPEKLLRSLKLFFDGIKKREISEASLGTANILYLVLRSLDLEIQVDEGNREHTFFAIEEPEAHLHPHLQRLVYKNYLKPRHGKSDTENQEEKAQSERITYFLTTHSPHIASVSPIRSLLLLKNDPEHNTTIGISGENISHALSPQESADIERYLDVSRAEGLFSRGIIFVEGDSEKFLVPVFAEKLGYDLDSYGISICSVGGTNFEPYIKFFGPSGFDLPFAVITDLDSCMSKKGVETNRGLKRIHALYSLLSNVKNANKKRTAAIYEKYGFFLNSSTFEIELNNSGWICQMEEAMSELCPCKAAIKRFKDMADETRKINEVITVNDPKRFIKDIEYVGKGRFAQRLSEKIMDVTDAADHCPTYIKKAIEHVINKVQ